HRRGRADVLDRDEQIEQRPLARRGEAVERDAEVALDEVGIDPQRDLAALRAELAQAVHRQVHLVADPGAVDHHGVAAALEQGPAQVTDHPRTSARARPTCVRWAWVMATASASAASARGARRRPASACTMRATWSLLARPRPVTAFFTSAGG